MATLNSFALLLGLLLKRLSGKTPPTSKRRQFLLGHIDLFDRLIEAMSDVKQPVVWFHAASLGEYAVVRPLMRKMREEGRFVVLTFFSSSGYDAIADLLPDRRDADYVCYLPLDTRGHARKFIRIVRPDCAVFAVSEYWPCFFFELFKANVPVYILSVRIGRRSYLLKWWAKPFVRLLRQVTAIFVHDEASLRMLHNLGIEQCVLTGDPLFDNALRMAASPYEDERVHRFTEKSHRVLVVGSLHDAKDLSLVAAAANADKMLRVICVPHEISQERLLGIKAAFEGKTVLYSECDAHTDFSAVQVLVIDFIGALARLYRYGNLAYVGGGFTPYLHSVIEPLVYGLPVAFGPRTERKWVAQRMAREELGSVVQNASQLQTFLQAYNSVEKLEAYKAKALQFVHLHRGATQQIAQYIL